MLSSWLTTYFLLLLGRAKIPDLFLHGHETLFATPLVCLASAIPLAELYARGGARRLAAVGLAAALVVVGFSRQWSAIGAQLANAL